MKRYTGPTIELDMARQYRLLSSLKLLCENRMTIHGVRAFLAAWMVAMFHDFPVTLLLILAGWLSFECYHVFYWWRRKRQIARELIEVDGS
jgi:hypothetical protein